jgi:hypothetical protein
MAPQRSPHPSQPKIIEESLGANLEVSPKKKKI